MYELEDLELWKDRPEKIVYKYSVSGDKWVYLELKKGCVAGEHYHKGNLKIKNPEVNIILKGMIEYTLKDVRTGKIEKVVVKAPKIIKIKPFAYHELKAIEDSMFLEPYDKEVSKKDRFELEK